MKLKRFWPLAPAAFLAVPLALSMQPAAAAPTPLVPNPVNIVNNNDDSSNGFRIHYQAGSCGGSYRILQPGYTSQAWYNKVHSMRLYQDSRVAVKSKTGATTYKIWGVRVDPGTSRCYVSMTNDRLYEVLSANGSHVGLDQY